MSVMPDHWIARMALEERMIDPFVQDQVSKGAISFGVSSYGYDFRLDRHYKVCRGGAVPVDPKNLSEELFEDFEGDYCVIPATSFVLAQSLEYFRIPRSILTLCTGKSSYARCGVVVNVTPFEPEWEGHATLCISNTGPRPVRIYSAEGIAQLVFFQATEECQRSYRDKKGKYQAQRGIVTTRVDRNH